MDDTWWSRSCRSGARHVDFDVQGLVLAGGNSIGTPGAITMVKSTLICGAGTPQSDIRYLPVPLSPQGDADFSGTIGAKTSTCTPTNVVFLIRIVPSGNWIANGAVRTASGNN